MARKRRGDPVHGWINLDKPIGLTSARAVARVKRITNAAKVGHGGTLDPLATGILPIALGEATKTTSFVMTGSKIYQFRVEFGESRDTDDSEGAVVETSDIRPDEEQIRAILIEFTGEISQMPPDYSALKVAGKRAYALARAGEKPDLQARNIQIDRLELLESGSDWAEFEVECGKGTYVRALGRDMAVRLGTFGHISRLRRTKCGPFSQNSAISLEKLDEFGHSARLAEAILPIETALDDIPALPLKEESIHRLQSGQTVQVSGTGEGMVYVTAGGRIVALAERSHDQVRPVRVFNL
jgi:tRNA pseudouridine55 synthase